MPATTLVLFCDQCLFFIFGFDAFATGLEFEPINLDILGRFFEKDLYIPPKILDTNRTNYKFRV